MIADLDETIRQLLIDEMPIKNGEIDVKFDQPKREWSSRLSKPTLNFYLYDLRENNKLRQHHWEAIAERGNRDQLAHLKRTPFRVDCVYMVTAWAAEPEDEHRIISRCRLCLFRNPVLPVEYLAGNLKNQPFEIQTQLAQYDKLTNPAEMWGSLDNEIRPSIPYVVTIALDPWQEVTGPLVKTFTLKPGQSFSMPRRTTFAELGEDSIMTFIGGTVREKTADGKSLAGINVAIKGTGMFAVSDEQGRYVLGSLPAGSFTLVAWLPDNKIKERKITIPSEDGDYDLIV
jgi:hypothetical protein